MFIEGAVVSVVSTAAEESGSVVVGGRGRRRTGHRAPGRFEPVPGRGGAGVRQGLERVVARPEPAGAPPRPSGDRKDPDHRVAAEHHVEQTLCDPARRTLSGQNGRGAERQSSTCLYSRPSFFPSDPTAKKTFHG